MHTPLLLFLKFPLWIITSDHLWGCISSNIGNTRIDKKNYVWVSIQYLFVVLPDDFSVNCSVVVNGSLATLSWLPVISPCYSHYIITYTAIDSHSTDMQTLQTNQTTLSLHLKPCTTYDVIIELVSSSDKYSFRKKGDTITFNTSMTGNPYNYKHLTYA